MLRAVISAALSGTDRCPDWIGGWRHVHSLNVSQDPMPLGVTIEGGSKPEAWILGEALARYVEESINGVWERHGMTDILLLRMEHGWSVEKMMLRFLVNKRYERSPPACCTLVVPAGKIIPSEEDSPT